MTLKLVSAEVIFKERRLTSLTNRSHPFGARTPFAPRAPKIMIKPQFGLDVHDVDDVFLQQSAIHQNVHVLCRQVQGILFGANGKQRLNGSVPHKHFTTKTFFFFNLRGGLSGSDADPVGEVVQSVAAPPADVDRLSRVGHAHTNRRFRFH